MRHVHHDSIIDWAKDTSKKWQWRDPDDKNGDFYDCHSQPTWEPELLYRKKPREFVKGHWYPCLDVNCASVKMWNGEIFIGQAGIVSEFGYDRDYFTEIGKSLGEIKFGE
jgi:hypothetical protein